MNSRNKWGRCLAWYDASLGRWSSPVRIRPTPLISGFEGVILKVNKKVNYLKYKNNTDYPIKKKKEMRDLYDREKKLLYWIKRAESDLEESDRTDVLKLVKHLQDQDRASIWIIRYITVLITMRKQITK